MACDDFLLNQVLERKINSPVLRIYSWDKETLSIGCNQVFGDSIYNDFNLPVVKRISGGQAVVHGVESKELTYSFVANYNEGAKRFYFEVGSILIKFLNKYGLNSNFGHDNSNYKLNFDCFESKTPGDIVVNGQKVIGNAQCKRKDVILQHGSVRLDLIGTLCGKEVNFSSAVKDFVHAFESELGVEFVKFNLSDNDIDRINESTIQFLQMLYNKC